MIEQLFTDVATPELCDGAILNEEYVGFKNDYLCLHALIMKHRPNSFFEVGTNMGTGINIITNAIYSYNPKAEVYSLDLPTELAHISLQHPISEGKGDRVGVKCMRNFTQLRGDSLKFKFKDYPCEGYFIDGEHDHEHVRHETYQALKNEPEIIIWHDADIPEVWRGIRIAHVTWHMGRAGQKRNKKRTSLRREFELYRITDTRIAYALKK